MSDHFPSFGEDHTAHAAPPDVRVVPWVPPYVVTPPPDAPPFDPETCWQATIACSQPADATSVADPSTRP